MSILIAAKPTCRSNSPAELAVVAIGPNHYSERIPRPKHGTRPMQQVLFRIPIKFNFAPDGIPIYGFGLMLFLSFVVSMWLAGRRAEREGVSKDRLLDLALPIFGFGIIAARIVFMIQYGVP